MRKRATLAATLAVFLLTNCNTPEAVAKFSSSAVVTLATGNALFDDMQASCVRGAQALDPLATFQVKAPPPACGNIATQAARLKAQSKLLSDRFTALNELATFGSAKTGSSAKELLQKSADQAGANDEHAKAAGEVAGFLTRIAAHGYQQKQLAKELDKVSGDVKAVLEGLAYAVNTIYPVQLKTEEDNLTDRYSGFASQHRTDAAALVALEMRWQSDLAAVATRRKAAQTYKDAIDVLIKGHQELVDHARNMKAKELTGLLSPYAGQLESMSAAIQKAL